MQPATPFSDVCIREPPKSGETDSSMMSSAIAGSDTPSSFQQHTQVIDHRERDRSREREHKTVEVFVVARAALAPALALDLAPALSLSLDPSWVIFTVYMYIN